MVNPIKKIVSSIIILSFCLTACASKNLSRHQSDNKDLVEVSTRVHLSKWSTKGIGEPLPSGTLLINPDEFEKDKVVIIRISGKTKATEVYYKDKSTPTDDTWVYNSKDGEEKTLTHQFKTTYMITQLITGENGGSLSERFEIPSD